MLKRIRDSQVEWNHEYLGKMKKFRRQGLKTVSQLSGINQELMKKLEYDVTRKQAASDNICSDIEWTQFHEFGNERSSYDRFHKRFADKIQPGKYKRCLVYIYIYCKILAHAVQNDTEVVDAIKHNPIWSDTTKPANIRVELAIATEFAREMYWSVLLRELERADKTLCTSNCGTPWPQESDLLDDYLWHTFADSRLQDVYKFFRYELSRPCFRMERYMNVKIIKEHCRYDSAEPNPFYYESTVPRIPKSLGPEESW